MNIPDISKISITDLASATSRPNKVVGLKFLNPPLIMRPVEVIRGYHTSDETLALGHGGASGYGQESCCAPVMRSSPLEVSI